MQEQSWIDLTVAGIAVFSERLWMELLLLPKDLETAARNSANATDKLTSAIVDAKRKYYSVIVEEGIHPIDESNKLILRLAELIGQDEGFLEAESNAREAVNRYLGEARMTQVVTRAAAKG